ncbi:MAG: hypothetical protein IKX20_02910 [Paludibacteraceae bacterium]|nr:hypothetical protein [Paludibacteraceae bacterium]
MTKENVRCSMKVMNSEGTILAEYVTYGAMIDKRTILTPEYIFHAHRNAGFGKTTILHRDGNTVKVNIERI